MRKIVFILLCASIACNVHHYRYEIKIPSTASNTGWETALTDKYIIKDGLIYFTDEDGGNVISKEFSIQEN